MNHDEWLLIRGDVQLADGRSWSFIDPCLTTRDAESLRKWLLDVATGNVPPAGFDGDDWPENLLWFDEPILAFSLADLSPTRATVRVHTGNEANPPWQADGDEYQFFVPLDVSREELVEVASVWGQELEPFPRR